MAYTYGDYEYAFAQALETAVGVEAVAGSLPPNLPNELIQVVGLGGSRASPGVLTPLVDVHARGMSEGAAQRLADRVYVQAQMLEETQIVADSVIVAIEPVGLPYLNPDPRNPERHRYSQSFSLTVKAVPAN